MCVCARVCVRLVILIFGGLGCLKYHLYYDCSINTHIINQHKAKPQQEFRQIRNNNTKLLNKKLLHFL